MANVRCPMCSKVNSPEAETCAFCGARIKPARNSAEQPGQPAGKPQDDADWLRSLRSGTSDSPAEDDAPSGSLPAGMELGDDSNVPDWLSRIRSRARSEVGDSSEVFDEAGSQPDWLSGVQSEAFSSESGLESAGSEEEPDWLSRLQGKPQQEPGQQASAETPAEAPSGEEESGWLSNLGGASGLSAWAGDEQAPVFDFGQPSTPESTPADMDWLSNLSPTEESPHAEQGGSGFGLTGFLSSLDRGEESSELPEQPYGSVEEPVEPVAGAAETPDWLAGFGGKEDAHLPGESDLPEWKEAPSEPASGETFSDWLSMGEVQPEADASAPAPSGESLPDWLSTGEFAGESKAPAQPAAQEGEFLSWLSSQDETSSTADEEKPVEESPAAGLPDWLRGDAEAAAEESPLPAASDDAGLPAWFSSFDSQEETVETQPAVSGEPEEAQAGWLAAFHQDETVTEPQAEEAFSGADQEISAEVSPESIEQAAAPAPFIDEEAPSWLREFASPAQPEVESGIPAFVDNVEAPSVPAGLEEPFASDLPEWLSEEAGPQPVEAAEQPVEAEGDEISRAELPSWVAAMRPVESLISEEPISTESDQRTEKAGPLAGMRGVLPVADHLFRYRKPPIYSAKLRVTEKQRNQASLMESIMTQESQPLLIPPRTVSAPRLIFRILIAFVLVMALLIPSLPGVGLDSLSMPVLYPAELLEMYQQIDQSLPQGQESTVLLAVDYEPGLSGEMSAAASPVVSHLMEQNVRIVVVSTVPSGPILAERLLRQVASASAPGYSLDERVVNLGYLPGGTISLLEFVQRPQFAAPATLSGTLAWQQTFLQNLEGFQDFAQVIVLTDTAETGRAWVEQVSPLMGNIPLFFVASAQAAPLLIPYLNENIGSGQPSEQHIGRIDGMVTGMMGGAQYGWVAQQANNPASRYWASYQIGIVIAIVLILVGGLYSGIKRLFSRNEKEEA